MSAGQSRISPPVGLALAAGTGTLLLWSGTPIANKIAVDYMDGFTVGVLRSSLAGTAAVIIAFGLRLPFPKSTRDRLLLVLSGLASFAVWPVMMSVGIEYTTAGHAALILATIPVIAVLIAAGIERRWPRRGWWLGAAIALIGAAVLMAEKGSITAAARSGSSLFGDMVIFLGGAVCAVGYVAGGRLAPRIGTAPTTFWGLSIAMLVLVPMLIAVQSEVAWASVPIDGWLAMGWLALLSSLVAYMLWFYALGSGGIGRISSMLLVMPAITLFGAALVLDESITLLLLASCAAIIFGTYFAQRYAQ